jgi:cytochrome P450
MTHEENVYPDPFMFKPERFFDENGKLKEEDRILAFGFGRRYLSSFTIVNHFVLTTAQSLCWRAGRKRNG